MKKTKNALVILAGGIGRRFNKKIPKQFNEINGKNLIEFFLSRIDTNNFDLILIVVKKTHQKYIKNLKYNFPLIKFIYTEPGKSRQLKLPAVLFHGGTSECLIVLSQNLD